MREIKFRAWDKNKCKFIIGWDVTGFLNVLNPFDRVDTENIILEQSTGLKDANGKEIYEGDIVKYPDGIKHICCDFSGNQIVEYINGSFSPFCGCGGEYSMTPHDTIVVGNIHENAELVEKDIEK